MRKNFIVSLMSVFLFAGARAAFADENPQPLWNPGDWDHAAWADNETTQHLSLFLHARDARKYCASDDQVVWLDRRTGEYYQADRPQYGRQKPGYFVCAHQARVVGAKPAPLP